MTPIAIAAYERLAKGRKAGDPLCRKEDGQAMEQMRYWFDPCVGAAGLVNYHWHDCRHTFCSRLVNGWSPVGGRGRVRRPQEHHDDDEIRASSADEPQPGGERNDELL
jgi:hypothetical protein